MGDPLRMSSNNNDARPSLLADLCTWASCSSGYGSAWPRLTGESEQWIGAASGHVNLFPFDQAEVHREGNPCPSLCAGGPLHLDVTQIWIWEYLALEDWW
jgi:hypothetical protein